MHELAVCHAIADAVRSRAGDKTVLDVHVRIGHLRQVVVDSLRFSWDVLVDGTDLEGATLRVEEVPAVVRCRDCGADTTLEQPILLCGACDRAAVDLVAGEEFQIVAIDVGEVDMGERVH